MAIKYLVFLVITIHLVNIKVNASIGFCGDEVRLKLLDYSLMAPINQELSTAKIKGNSITAKSFRENTKLDVDFDYELNGSVISNTVLTDTFKVLSADKGSSSISGRWSMFLDYVLMSNKITDQAFLKGLKFQPLGAGFPKHIKSDTVTNDELLPAVANHYEKNNMNHMDTLVVQADSQFYVTLTQPIDGKTHNGTQAVRFLELINEKFSKKFSVESIVIKFRNPLAFDMIFNIAGHQ